MACAATAGARSTAAGPNPAPPTQGAVGLMEASLSARPLRCGARPPAAPSAPKYRRRPEGPPSVEMARSREVDQLSDVNDLEDNGTHFCRQFCADFAPTRPQRFCNRGAIATSTSADHGRTERLSGWRSGRGCPNWPESSAYGVGWDKKPPRFSRRFRAECAASQRNRTRLQCNRGAATPTPGSSSSRPERKAQSCRTWNVRAEPG